MKFGARRQILVLGDVTNVKMPNFEISKNNNDRRYITLEAR